MVERLPACNGPVEPDAAGLAALVGDVDEEDQQALNLTVAVVIGR